MKNIIKDQLPSHFEKKGQEQIKPRMENEIIEGRVSLNYSFSGTV